LLFFICSAWPPSISPSVLVELPRFAYVQPRTWAAAA
jgi:hypothetical protein